MRKNILNILKKKNKTKIVCLTAYSKSVAKILDKICDIVLVGDSMAHVLYGQTNTHSVSLKNIIQHTISVKQGIKKSLLVVDMPKNSYNSLKKAKFNAKKILNLTKCDAVKIENNNGNFKILEGLVKAKIPVMGHIGYTPQFKKKFKLEGQSTKEIDILLNQAKLIEISGAFAIVLECLTSKAAKLITSQLKIPTIGIGSSSHCDGQVLVTDDMLGLSGFNPKFVRKYVNLNRIIENSVKKYTRDVKLIKFPSKKHFLNGTKYR